MAEECELLMCPACKVVRRFEYKIWLRDFAGECGHRVTEAEGISEIKARNRNNDALGQRDHNGNR
jgi:hypothetical protein